MSIPAACVLEAERQQSEMPFWVNSYLNPELHHLLILQIRELKAWLAWSQLF